MREKNKRLFERKEIYCEKWTVADALLRIKCDDGKDSKAVIVQHNNDTKKSSYHPNPIVF